MKGSDSVLNVAICDDEPIIVNQVKDILKSYSHEKNLELNVVEFYNAETLYAYLKNGKCDLIYLDIKLDNMNGVELGRKIRENYKDYITKIAYISAEEGYERQMLDVQPLTFLSKPLSKEVVIKTLEKAITAKRQLEERQVFTYENKKKVYRVPLNEIIYFECMNHNIKIVTVSGSEEFYGTMTNVINQINSDTFLLIHRSYLVNFENIRKAEFDSLIMINGEVLMISRLKRQEVREKIKKLMKGI